ncbi:hypothetical protein AVEN_249155-1 [Araneus ventricosus]|uniref:Uncharacterized protein n=1 Tax=Araneus ventricosus TaxID=182803 RepID=A0A4Y2D769_ARAVE|nr:hypothetical protein AVEN_249155-1 [Araneus ventricosus]
MPQGHPQQFQQGHPQQIPQGHPQQVLQAPQQGHPQQAIGGEVHPKPPQQFASVPPEQLSPQQQVHPNLVKNEQKAPNSINEVPQAEKKPVESQNFISQAPPVVQQV